MRTKLNLLAISLGANVFATQESFAFWDQSHQLIAEIASYNITPKTKEEVNRLLKVVIAKPGSEELSKNTSTMGTAASWADNIKSYKDSDSFATCHYTDIPLTKEMIGKDIIEEEALQKLSEVIRKSQDNSVNCLKRSIKTLLLSNESEVNKAIALRMVIHLVGDIGQPLHNSALVEGNFADAGGNNIKFEKAISFVNIDGSTSVANNLHKLWDGALNVYFQFIYDSERNKKGLYSADEINATKSDALAITQYKDFTFLSKNMEADSKENSIENWIVDSYKVAVNYVYTDLKFPSQNFSGLTAVSTGFKQNWKTYHELRSPIIKNQVKKSGIRLAMVLNQIFDSEKQQNQYKTLVDQIEIDATIPAFRKK